jgi:hypothetical protein
MPRVSAVVAMWWVWLGAAAAPPVPQVFVEDVKSSQLKAGELEQLSGALCEALAKGTGAGVVVCEDEERAAALTRDAVAAQGKAVPVVASPRQVARWRVLSTVESSGKGPLRLRVTLMDNATWKPKAEVVGEGTVRQLRSGAGALVKPLCVHTGCR